MSDATRLFVFDGSRLTSEAEFWQEYLRVVQPDGAEFFGRNLAAFRDALTAGGPGWPKGPCRMRIQNHQASQLRPEFLAKLVEIAHETQDIVVELA